MRIKRAFRELVGFLLCLVLLGTSVGCQANASDAPRDLLEANLRARDPLAEFRTHTDEEMLNAAFRAIKAFEAFWMGKTPEEILEANLKAREALVDFGKKKSPDEILDANLRLRNALADVWKRRSPDEIQDAALSAMEPFWNTDLVPPFSFSDLVFSADYASVEEKSDQSQLVMTDKGDVDIPVTLTSNTTCYYDADGHLLRRVTVSEVIEYWPNEEYHLHSLAEANYAKIDDSEYFAGIITMHQESPYVNRDTTRYVIRHGDQEYDVDEEGNLLPEDE